MRETQRKSYRKHVAVRREQARAAYRKNRAKRLRKQKRYYRKNIEKRKAYNKEYAARNKPDLQAYQKEYKKTYQYPRSKQRASTRKWRRKNIAFARQRSAEHEARRRAQKRCVLAEPVDRHVVFNRDQGICQLCRRKVSSKRFSIDHIIPLVRGGPHTYENVQLAHLRCNIIKGDRMPDPENVFKDQK